MATQLCQNLKQNQAKRANRNYQIGFSSIPNFQLLKIRDFLCPFIQFFKFLFVKPNQSLSCLSLRFKVDTLELHTHGQNAVLQNKKCNYGKTQIGRR
jgi:hypothetical protein